MIVSVGRNVILSGVLPSKKSFTRVRPLFSVLQSEDESVLDEVEQIQPVLFAVMASLAALWRSYGVEPDAVVGHSHGELVAAYVSGALSLEDAARLVCRRARLLNRLVGAGGMLSVELTPEQLELFRRTQAMMSLLEGHASYVMNAVAKDVVADLPRLQAALARRRAVGGWEKRVQRAIGFDQKVAQYDAGEHFVGQVVERIGMPGFNLVWSEPGNMPRPGEIEEPDRWIARVVG